MPGQQCVQVSYDEFYNPFIDKMASSESFRRAFRNNFVQACDLLGTNLISIEFAPVSKTTQESFKVAYRIFEKPYVASPVDLHAFEQDMMGRPAYKNVHVNDNNPNKVEVFPSPSGTPLVVPVMHKDQSPSQQSSYRALGHFLSDDSLTSYHDAFLKALAEEFHRQIAISRFQSGLYMCTDGVIAWLHFRFDIDPRYYHSADWKT